MQQIIARFVRFQEVVDTGFTVLGSVYGYWNEAAGVVVEQSPNAVYFAMLRKKDGRADYAKRKLDSLKAVNPDDYKAAKEDAKTYRNIVTETAKARGSENDRMVWSRIVDRAGEQLGMAVPEKSGSKGGTTSYDKVAEALRTLRNHLMETEASQCLELKDLWSEIEEAAVNDGILKDE